jgi:hypothetical protein
MRSNEPKCRVARSAGLITAAILLSLKLGSHAAGAQAWTLKPCMEQVSTQHDAFEIPASEAEALINQVAKSIGLVGVDVHVVSCELADKAYAYVSDGNEEGVPAGKYIVYNPAWLREVIGKDQVQAGALFGHELGHLLNDHFDAAKDLSTQQKETEADHFAGCAVARLLGQWADLEDLLSRVRSEKDELYPDRLSSLEAAKNGFDACGGGNKVVVEKEINCPDGYSIFDNSFFSDSYIAISMPEGAKVCFIGLKVERNTLYGLQIRPRRSDLPDNSFSIGVTSPKLCRVMFSEEDDDPRNFNYPMGPDKTPLDCAARVRHERGTYGRLGCQEAGFGGRFDLRDDRLSRAGAELIPTPDCGWG